jgi:hypothetical protein
MELRIQHIRSAMSIGIKRRRVLALAGMSVLAGKCSAAAATVDADTDRGRSVIEALELHGQWAPNPGWAREVHWTLGARSVISGYAEASGLSRIQTATQLSLASVAQDLPRARGAVVILMAQPYSTLLQDAKRASNEVRDMLPLDTYCVFSPLTGAAYGQEIGISLTLGW